MQVLIIQQNPSKTNLYVKGKETSITNYFLIKEINFHAH